MTDKEYTELIEQYKEEHGYEWQLEREDADCVYDSVREWNPILAEKLRRLIKSRIGWTLLDDYGADAIVAFDLYDDRNVAFADGYKGGTTDEQDRQIMDLAGKRLNEMYMDLYSDGYGRAAQIINGACEDVYNGYPTDPYAIGRLESKRRIKPCDGNY